MPRMSTVYGAMRSYQSAKQEDVEFQSGLLGVELTLDQLEILRERKRDPVIDEAIEFIQNLNAEMSEHMTSQYE